MAGTITVQGLLTGTIAGTQYIGPFTLLPNPQGFFESTPVTLVSGPNTITVPTWAMICLIIPPVANGVTLSLKGISGDTGFSISPNQLSLLSFASNPPASFVITAASNTSTPTTIVFS